MAQGISTQKSAGFVNGRVVANGCKNVEEFTINLLGTAHAVRCDDGQTHARSKVEKFRITNFLSSFKVALEFNKYIVATINGGKATECLVRTNLTFATKHRCEWPFFTACKTDQAGRKFFQVFKGRCTFSLRSLAHLEARYELA